MPRERREQLILDVAGQVFARAGYEAAPMDEIAERAGVSKPMLYTYFGSKEGLYLAYIERAGGELLERLVGATPGRSGRPRRCGRGSPSSSRSSRSTATGGRCCSGSSASTRPFAERVAEVRERIARAIRRMLEDGVDSSCSGYAPAAADAIAHALVGAGESLANWWLDHPEIPRDQVAAWYFGVVQAVVTGATRP